VPLDADARRYADNLFAERREQIEEEIDEATELCLKGLKQIA
jgi:hypothetical protein